MKINWNAIAIFFALLVTVIGWGVSVEVRMAHYSSLQEIHERLNVIETNLQELLVDMKVRHELEKKGILPAPMPVPRPPIAEGGGASDKPPEEPKSASQIKDAIQADARKWAASQLKFKK